MEKPTPMDRLLCGDVGFGKTEVALRAAFKAVMGGKQVAVLVPTTVLAQQHYQTFTERFLQFGPSVDVVCRFRTQKEQKASLERVRDGRTDILIGTHAILNQKRVTFKDLGLLIVDEEQRFGVKQKEKIKQLSAGIDVLTLSATPIPRTLHMSLVGARDMSVIETPPAERFPIQTYVIEANDAVLAGAIRRELKRGGQIYFIYNRVETIERMRLRLETLVPEARIQIAHGRMTEAVLERVMMEFYEGEYDILLSTSIVENGLDVANANTIIVYNADYFGLSQLYQMRGRVGRSHRMAYAYFVYQADKVLTEAAEKRLHAMKEFAELGAGFKIAMRDLEIRGAGDLLGAQQHGHIASVGFEMYCRLLDEAVRSLESGRPVEEKEEPIIELAVEAYIDGEYIDDAMHKIEIYQRIAAIRNEEHISSLLDELIDRFGEPTKPVLRLLDVARIKNYARNLGIKSIVDKEKMVELTLTEQHSIEPERVVALKKKLGPLLMLLPSQRMMRIRLKSQKRQDELLKLLLETLRDLSKEIAEFKYK
ncbi:MAG: DEAD/DEAH box helicase [Synergistaceae bacterium]|nr:DEAD/DEAH box helicase [Synergistaceae bacterium]